VSVYSTRFFFGVAPTNSTTVYTVPSAMTVVLRDIECFNGSSSEDTISIRLVVPGLTAMLVRFASLPTLTGAQWQGRSVMNSGDAFAVQSSTGQSYLTVSGYLLSP
jgi:hypothetical protein